MHHDTLNNCPFCTPTIAQVTWLETDGCRVIYNIAPIVPGHSLVIPKQHIASLLELEDTDLSELFRTARRAVSILLKALQGEGFDLSLQDGEIAGQTVPHLHIHLVPRKPGDSLDQDWHQQVLDSESRPRLSNKELQAMVWQLREGVRLYAPAAYER